MKIYCISKTCCCLGAKGSYSKTCCLLLQLFYSEFTAAHKWYQVALSQTDITAATDDSVASLNEKVQSWSREGNQTALQLESFELLSDQEDSLHGTITSKPCFCRRVGESKDYVLARCWCFWCEARLVKDLGLELVCSNIPSVRVYSSLLGDPLPRFMCLVFRKNSVAIGFTWFHCSKHWETLTKNCLGAMADRLLLVGMELSQIETQIKSATIMTCYETKVKVSSLQFGAPCGCLYPVYDGSPFTAKPWTSCSKPPVPSLQAICVLALGMGYISIVGGTIRRRESRHFLKS